MAIDPHFEVKCANYPTIQDWNPIHHRIGCQTHKLLQDALIELVAEEGHEQVSIREILDSANVGPSTFDSHFQDNEQLLRSILERFKEALMKISAGSR